jgi:hypothetical protein
MSAASGKSRKYNLVIGAEGFPANLQANLTPGAEVKEVDAITRRLRIPAGSGKRYRLAQLDDYAGLSRRHFVWKSGSHLRLEARASSSNLPGTWGFGFWNDPFSMGILNRERHGAEFAGLRWPALPKAAWFFYASPPSYLSLRDDLPARAGLAATFQSTLWPAIAFTPLLLLFPIFLIHPFMRLARRLLRKSVKQAAAALPHDPTRWHSYEIYWRNEQVKFLVDGQRVLETDITPSGRLGLVIWVDNQYMALPPGGQIRYGMLPNPEPSWIEIRSLKMRQE